MTQFMADAHFRLKNDSSPKEWAKSLKIYAARLIFPRWTFDLCSVIVTDALTYVWRFCGKDMNKKMRLFPSLRHHLSIDRCNNWGFVVLSFVRLIGFGVFSAMTSWGEGQLRSVRSNSEGKTTLNESLKDISGRTNGKSWLRTFSQMAKERKISIDRSVDRPFVRSSRCNLRSLCPSKTFLHRWHDVHSCVALGKSYYN